METETLQLSDEQLSKVTGGDYLLTDEMINSGDYFIEGHSIEYNNKIYYINAELTIESAFKYNCITFVADDGSRLIVPYDKCNA